MSDHAAAEHSTARDEHAHSDEVTAESERIVVANEFAEVAVRRVATRNGTRLEIFSPRRGTRILLDAVELDCLSYQEPGVFTTMLEQTPNG